MIRQILKCFKAIHFAAAVIIAVLCLSGSNCYAEKKYKIKFATVAPEGSIWVNYMKDVAKRLESKSKGRIRLVIYASSIAGDELDVLKKIRIGQLHSAAFTGVGITEILPSWRVMDLPFLFRNIDEVKTVQNELKDLFTEEFRKKGFEYISWVEVGDVYLLSKKEIKARKDLKGLKIWTWSGDPVSKKTFTIMESTPISLAITDVTTAISTNMIDTVYSPPVGALATQWNENMNFMTGIPIAHSTGAIIISKKYFDKLPKDLAKLFNEEIKLSMSKLTDELQIQTKEAIKVIEDKGITISPAPEGNELQLFYDLNNEVANGLKGDVYPGELLNKVQEILYKKRSIK